MRSVSRLASILPLPLFCFTSRTAVELSGAVAAGILAGAAVAVFAMRKRGNSSRSAAPELEEVLDSEIFKTACRAAGLVPFRCDRAGNFSGLAENSDCWPFRDGRPAPPAEWMAAEDLDLFQAGWDDLLADRKKEMLLRYRVDRPGFPLHYELYLFRMEDETGFAGVIRDVTEEKTGEAAVEETNIMYRSLLDSLLGWVFAKDPDNGFRYVMVNRSRNLFIGNHMGDVIGKTDEEIFSPEVAMRHRRQDEEIVRTGLEYRGIGSYADPEGKISHVRIFKRLYVRPDGSRLILGIGIDVTHEYELECEFGRNVEKLNLHIRDERSMNRCLAFISGQGEFDTVVNSFLRELAGGTRADRLAIFLADKESGGFSVSHEWNRMPESPGHTRLRTLECDSCGALRERLEADESVELPDLSAPPAGLELPAAKFLECGVRSLLVSGIRREGRLVGFAGMAFYGEPRDFTGEDRRGVVNAGNLFLLAFEREGQLHELEESAAVQRQMIDNMPMPVLLFDPDFNILSVNSKVCEASAKTESELIGRKCYSALCSCDEPPEWCPMKRTLEDGTVTQSGNRIGNKDYVIHTQPIFDKEGKLIYILETRLDVTEQLRQAGRLSTQNLLLSNAAALAHITYFSGNETGDCRVIGGSTAIGLPTDGFHPFRFSGWLVPEDREMFEALCRRIIAGADNSLEMVCRSEVSGERRSYRLVVSPDRNRPECFVGILFDITAAVAFETERQELVKSLKNHVENERIVNAGLSQIVLEEGFDLNVEAILRIIATQLGGDQAFFGVFEESGTRFLFCHEWLNHGVSSLKSVKDPVFREQFPKWYERFRNNELLAIPDIPNSEYAGVLKEPGWRTLLCVPVWSGRDFCGILGISFIREAREVSELDRAIMRSAARLVEISREHQLQSESFDALDRQNRLIIRSIQIPICLFDEKGKLIRCNPAAEALTGVSEEEMLARPCSWSLCGYAESPTYCPVMNVIQTSVPCTYEMVINGHECMVTASPIRNRNGELVHVIESVIDMSEINESKRQLEVAVKAALAADKAKSAFLATMSHELRTPLNAVIGFSELLKADNLPAEERHEYTQSINLAGNALLNLINDVLDISKIEAEQLVFVSQPTDVKAMIDEIAAVFRYKIQEKELYFRTECPEDLPVLMLDSQRLRQILFNLVGNAVKFTPSGGITLTVDFLANDAGSGILRIRVADTGIGIRPESQDQIFLPFVQQDAVRDSRVFNGTGLGLAISKRLAIGMGGDLTVESVPGRGSCFIVNLPKIACTDQPPLVAESEEEDDQLSGRVLLVDDVPMNLRVLQAMATTLGFECVCAANGREALAIFDREQKFDVILTDLWMPEMNGMELAEWIAERTGGALPVIAVTADTQIAGELPGGFAGVLLKPITPRTLGKAIREARRKR